MTSLTFEKSVSELENKIEELRHLSSSDGVNIAEEIARLKTKMDRLLKNIYARLTPTQKVQVARHEARPHCRDYIAGLIEDFTPLAGDRYYAEDPALTGGLGRFNGRNCIIIGQEKGQDTESRLHHNFGMPRPEGYRKAERLMKMADRFKLPILSFVDTAGAYPGVGAEERGQAQAIASCIETSLKLHVPLISVIIGEGGSGGAIAIATANTVLMLEHAVYSVISPEGCASILWRSAKFAEDAATALCLTAQDLKKFQIIDHLIKEPLGGAHRAPEETITQTGEALKKALNKLLKLDPSTLQNQRREKFLKTGQAT